MKLRHYYYESSLGCRIILAPTLTEAKKKAKKEVGSLDLINNIRLATDMDKNYIISIGGYIEEPIILNHLRNR